jgi:hypothetical protein
MDNFQNYISYITIKCLSILCKNKVRHFKSSVCFAIFKMLMFVIEYSFALGECVT